MDTLSPEQRSERMRRVKAKNTRPELRVRRLAHALGYRFRLHRGDLPGRPDLAFIGRRRAVFVHGCFWHRHDCAAGRRWPKSRVDLWRSKLNANARRDAAVNECLRADGWRSLVIWECEARDAALVEARLRDFLDA